VPEADATRDSERIAIALAANTMDYYAGVAWPDRAPLMVQGLLVRAFENTGRTPAVARDSAGIGADYILQTELRAFEARYDAPNAAPRVVVEISAKLTTMPEHKIIGSYVAREEVQASANNVSAVVDAFNKAAAPAVIEIAEWTLKTAPE
jgi:cholesterol transport system auxiliary component